MAEAVTISVEARDAAKNKGTGTRAAQRIRASGRIPAILYGHKQANLPLTVAHDDVWTLVKKGTHVAQLKIGESTEMALIRDVQWDHLGKEIIHLDFYRVSAHERVRTEVPITLHGSAIGLTEGGTVEQPVHSVTVSCEATSIPDALRLEISHLHLNDVIHVRDVALPAGMAIEADPELVLVHVVFKHVAAETPAAPAEGTTAEPEVIGRKEKKDEADVKA
jgi:large subunit ribosomal protein L25